MRLRPALALAALAGALLAPHADAAPSYGATSVFASVPLPGHADTSLLLPDGTVLVSTNRAATGTSGPSKLFRYSARGDLVRTYVVRGQDLAGDHGTMSMVLDGQGRVYVADYAPARVLRFDLKTGAQTTYATVPDLPLCAGAALVTPVGCDNGIPGGPRKDAQPWPDGLAFLPSGRLLVTDFGQGTVFSVANGGGAARVWLQGPQLRSTFGPNQPVLTPAGDLLLNVTASTVPATAGRGVLYRVGLSSSGTAGTVTQVYATNPGDGPDGFALGRSGRVYLPMLVTNRVAVVGPEGTEVGSLTSGQFDSPSSVTFVGTDVLVTNLTYFTGNHAHDVISRVAVADRGVPAARPRIRA
jgi:sugar lactone lactonase YvrE